MPMSKLEYDANKILGEAGLAQMQPKQDPFNTQQSLAQYGMNYMTDVNNPNHPSNKPGFNPTNTPESLAGSKVVQQPIPQLQGNKSYHTNTGYDFSTFQPAVQGIESFGGDYSVVNKGTGAMGAHQMMPSTLTSLKKRTGENFTNDEFINSKPLQDKYFGLLTEDNAKVLKNYNVAVNPLTMWAAHNVGPKQAQNIFSGEPLTKRTTAYIKNNLPKGMEPTRENYLSYYGPKFGY